MKVGSRIDGRYHVEELLGEGAMGRVFLARDVGLNRLVALKIIHPELARDPVNVARFRREAQALATVRNDHVVQVYAFGELEDTCFFAMEYVRGQSLDQIIDEHALQGTVVPLYRALSVLRLAANGLGSVHAKKLVHRDLKPANIVIEEITERPVIVDFGLAHARVRRRAALEQPRGGTPLYMAPEQADRDGSVSSFTDQYAFACVAFELLAGAAAFDGDDVPAILARHRNGPAPSITKLRPDLRATEPVFARAFTKEPLLRFETCSELVFALERALVGHKDERAAPTGSAELRVFAIGPRELHDVVRRATQMALRPRRFSVALLEAASLVLDAAQGEAPDLVLADLAGGGSDVLEMLARLRDLPGGDRTRIIGVGGQRAADEWRLSEVGLSGLVDRADAGAVEAVIRAVAIRAEWIRPTPCASTAY
jgi:eukaryotic-like serine/threonine-protein kinase